ncbi:hypothetical protein B0J11DRAFT_538005 [Dendryphion nanum]|uniref:Uncharacterized protein n=1 Tax=Dendryphion nanum TaxID=256645 RepID=A0A9P9DCZ4_9PLEO|nr:hypothetical protein B0J11DRAFT_538005 [Dendryphion nanum]
MDMIFYSCLGLGYWAKGVRLGLLFSFFSHSLTRRFHRDTERTIELSRYPSLIFFFILSFLLFFG